MTTTIKQHKIYECAICGGVHPWEWDGDCRDNHNRYEDADDYAQRNHLTDAEQLDIRPMSERVAADRGELDLYNEDPEAYEREG